MATLLDTTINGTLSATTNFSSPYHFTNFNTQRYREYRSNEVIITNGSYVDLFANTNGYERMYGVLSWWGIHGYFSQGMLRFQLSQYGLNVITSPITNDPFTASLYNPVFGTNYLRFTNNDTNGTQGGYYFTIRVSGLGGFVYSSSYINTQVR